MQVFASERVIFFDVDNTLVLSAPKYARLGVIQIKDPYEDKIVYRLPHRPHIKLLKNNHARGATVIVWSKNGYRWAQSVIEALGLSEYVDVIMTKPFAFADDEPPERWMGEHVFIPADNSFGQE